MATYGVVHSLIQEKVDLYKCAMLLNQTLSTHVRLRIMWA